MVEQDDALEPEWIPSPPRSEFSIPIKNMPKLQQRLNALNKCAAKLGCPPITLTIINEERFVKKRGDTPAHLVSDIHLDGEPPQFSGWKFLGRVSHVGEKVGNLLYAVPGEAEAASEGS